MLELGFLMKLGASILVWCISPDKMPVAHHNGTLINIIDSNSEQKIQDKWV